jgi:hypothetical protein
MAIRANQKVSRVIWEQIKQNKAGLTEFDDQSILQGFLGGCTKRAILVCRLLVVTEINQTMWCPQSFKTVLHGRKV